MNSQARQNIRIQKVVTLVAVSLFLIKITAWWLTQSIAILTDALESTINIISGFIGLYSLNLSARPKDENHPYGHGKVEFVSAAIEGTLISLAGIYIIAESVNNLRYPHEIKQLDYGILLISVSALINYAIGAYSVRTGKKNHSLALIASGNHLKSDTWSTVGIIAGLIALLITGVKWIDSVVAMGSALYILYTGYRIIRASLAGIMDEADSDLLEDLVKWLDQNRQKEWVDLHNLRIIKYGGILHLDCHLTVPWYLNVHEAHNEVHKLESLVRDKFGDSVELFVHTDGCLDYSCNICTLENCPERKHAFNTRLNWTVRNISTNQKHSMSK